MHRLGFMIEDPAGGDLDGESRGGRGGRVLRVVPFVEHEHDGNNRYGGGMAGGGSFGRHNHPPMTTEYTIDTPRDNRDHQQQQQHQQFIPESHSLPPLPSALVSPQPPPITVNQPTTDEKQHLHQPPLPTVRSSSPIIPALQKKLNGGTAPISMDSEYPDPDQAAAAASKPKKKFLQRKKTGDPNGYSSKRGSLDDASQQQQKSGGGGPLQLPIGEEPEVLDPDLVTPFAPVIKVHGELIVRCVLSKTFKLREFGLGVVGNRLDIWDDRQVARRASKDNLSTPTTAAPNTGKVRLSKLVSTNIIPKDLNDQMVDGFGWGDETPLPSPDLLIQSTMLIIMNGIDDTRDKVTILCIGLWELITRKKNDGSGSDNVNFETSFFSLSPFIYPISH